MAEPATVEIEVKGETPTPKKQPERGCNKKGWAAVAGLVIIGGLVGGLAGGLIDQAGLIRGTWATNYGSYITVTDTAWYSGKSVASIKKTTGSYVIWQNPPTDLYNPNAYVKVEYHPIATGWAHCMSVYDAPTLEAAESTDTSDIYNKGDAAAGCNGFPFTEVSVYDHALKGRWKTNFDQEIAISDGEWKVDGATPSRIEAYGAGWVLMQNPSDDAYNPDKWTLVLWHPVEGSTTGEWAHCMSVYDGASAAAALAKDTSEIYKPSDAAAGCNGFPFTVASAAA